MGGLQGLAAEPIADAIDRRRDAEPLRPAEQLGGPDAQGPGRAPERAALLLQRAEDQLALSHPRRFQEPSAFQRLVEAQCSEPRGSPGSQRAQQGGTVHVLRKQGGEPRVVGVLANSTPVLSTLLLALVSGTRLTTALVGSVLLIAVASLSNLFDRGNTAVDFRKRETARAVYRLKEELSFFRG